MTRKKYVRIVLINELNFLPLGHYFLFSLLSVVVFFFSFFLCFYKYFFVNVRRYVKIEWKNDVLCLPSGFFFLFFCPYFLSVLLLTIWRRILYLVKEERERKKDEEIQLAEIGSLQGYKTRK